MASRFSPSQTHKTQHIWSSSPRSHTHAAGQRKQRRVRAYLRVSAQPSAVLLKRQPATPTNCEMMRNQTEKELRFNLPAWPAGKRKKKPISLSLHPRFPPFTPSKRATVARRKSCRTQEVGNKRYTMQFVFENTYFVCVLARNPRDSPSSGERKSGGCTSAIQLDGRPNRQAKYPPVPKQDTESEK